MKTVNLYKRNVSWKRFFQSFVLILLTVGIAIAFNFRQTNITYSLCFLVFMFAFVQVDQVIIANSKIEINRSYLYGIIRKKWSLPDVENYETLLYSEFHYDVSGGYGELLDIIGMFMKYKSQGLFIRKINKSWKYPKINVGLYDIEYALIQEIISSGPSLEEK